MSTNLVGVHILYSVYVTPNHLNGILVVDSSYYTASRQIYRLALPLRTPETLSSLSKSRIFLT